MCMFGHVCVNVYICMFIGVYICECLCMCACSSMYICSCISVCLGIFIYVNVCHVCVCGHVCVSVGVWKPPSSWPETGLLVAAAASPASTSRLAGSAGIIDALYYNLGIQIQVLMFVW